MSLDIGCGGSEEYKRKTVRGNINCDLLKPIWKIPNFVICDAHFLPFKSEAFVKVFMFDILEHLENPFKTLLEIKRILGSKGVLELGTPNALYLPKILKNMVGGGYVTTKSHIATWGKAELENLFIRAGLKAKIDYETYRDCKIPFHYRVFVKVCPFPSLKHRQLKARVEKCH